MYHDTVANLYWNRQYEEFPTRSLLLDDVRPLLAESNAVPIPFGPGELPDEGRGCGAEQVVPWRPATAVVGDRDHDRCRRSAARA